MLKLKKNNSGAKRLSVVGDAISQVELPACAWKVALSWQLSQTRAREVSERSVSERVVV